MSKLKAIIIGAGPAGLTAAYELLERTDIQPIIIEQNQQLGGISQTIKYHGNLMDIGPHRFFTKSQRVKNFWGKFLSLSNPTDPTTNDLTMLLCQRKTRIYFLKKLFDYPVKLSWQTLSQLGLIRTSKIGVSYLKSLILPIKEKSLEDFFINRFGRELYQTFFKDYTEKLWGISCSDISPEWGGQRVKGLSILTAIKHALTPKILKTAKSTETSLIESFHYPKLGAGQLWEEVGKTIQVKGGQILTGCQVTAIIKDNNKIKAVEITDGHNQKNVLAAEYFFSSMPIKNLISCLNPAPHEEIKNISEQLRYRDLISIGILLKKIKLREKDGQNIKDNWLYIQEPGVKLGRLQIFNNWSPHLIKSTSNFWLGLEYYCQEDDDLWQTSDEKLIKLAEAELIQIGLAEENSILDATVIRLPKAYPAYFGEGYKNFSQLRAYLDKIENLWLIGRNGMHKYNNQDHSMLTAMTAVDNIINHQGDKSNIWAVNTENDYHEEKDG